MSDATRTVALTGNSIVDALIIGGAWAGPAITYSFAAGDIDANGIPDFEEGDWKDFYREITGNVESFAAITFREVAEPGNINFRLVAGAGGESGVPGPGTTTVDTVVGINPDVAGAAAVVRLGTYSEAWIHEIGHALGLKHTHDADANLGGKLPGVEQPEDQGTGYLNSQIYTVMGYTGPFLGEDNPFTAEVDIGTPLNAQPGSFGAIDIAALQHLYGARAHNTGNDVYRFSDDVDFNRGYTTIWDTGGIDTIAYAGTGRAKIDLRAATLEAEIGGGGWVSTSEALTGGFTIANGVTIERARGNLGDDILIGNAADNTLTGLAGDDVLDGGGGQDRLVGGAGADRLDGGSGADTMIGGAGDDLYIVDHAGDRVHEAADGGIDTVESAVSFTIRRHVENLSLTGTDAISGTGNDADNRLLGNDAANRLAGGAGDDLLEGMGGADRLVGGAGDDRLVGGAGIDRLVGGAGRDTFVFAPGDTGRDAAGADIVIDFEAGDMIDLGAWGAALPTGFLFVGPSAFGGGEGELRYRVSGRDTFVEGDLDGDRIADLVIRLGGEHLLTIDDFVF